MAKRMPGLAISPRPRRCCTKCHKGMDQHQLDNDGMVRRVVKREVLCERPLPILDLDTNLPTGVW